MIHLESKPTNDKKLKNVINVDFDRFEPPGSTGVCILSQNLLMDPQTVSWKLDFVLKQKIILCQNLTIADFTFLSSVGFDYKRIK